MYCLKLRNHFSCLIEKGLIILFIGLFMSCDTYFKKNTPNNILARVGDTYLHKDDISLAFPDNLKASDSLAFIDNYINNWASDQLLFDKSRINLSEEQLASFDLLLLKYKRDLYKTAYLEALVRRGVDSLVTAAALLQFYDEEMKSFELKETIAQIRFVTLPLDYIDKEAVGARLKRFTKSDQKYLDSITVQFNSRNFNDSVWVSSTKIIREIPPLAFGNNKWYLKNESFFDLQDSIGVYLGNVVSIKEVGEIAPLSYIKATIKQVIISRRRLNFVRNLKSEILEEAIDENEFEIYPKNKE